MDLVDKFMDCLVGNFNNQEQIAQERKNGKQIHPEAKHITRIIDERILNLPPDFQGHFVLEESYYINVQGKNSKTPHIFLFQQMNENTVSLKSFEQPKNPEQEIVNANPDWTLDYNQLVPSAKMSEVHYTYHENGHFTCDTTSDFGHGLQFRLKEDLSTERLEVLELFTKDGVALLHFDTPIIYKRV